MIFIKTNKRLIIIGAGITGLSAGIHALEKGYKVQIYEKNNFSGGCATGWNRDNYYIDNCMHWLTGTNQHTKSFKLWKKLGAINETSNLYQGDFFYKSTYDNQEISLFLDTDKVRDDMIKTSPTDIKEINRFITTVNSLIKANKQDDIFNTLFNTINGYTKSYIYYHRQSLGELAKKFSHPLLQKLFTDYFPSDYSALTLVCAYATFASGNGKVYANGSKKFAQNITDRFIKLGGEIYYNSDVSHIEIIGDTFKSITVNNKKVEGDYLIWAADLVYLFNNLINKKYMPTLLKNKLANQTNNKIVSSFHVAYLVDKDKFIDNETTIYEVPLIKVGKSTINRLVVKDYSYLYKDKDKKVIQLFIVQNMEDISYWQNLYNENKDSYELIKKETVNNLTNILLDKFLLSKTDLTLLDSWTPVTYNNYFNSYYGSYMGFVLNKNRSLKKIPSKIKGLKNLFIASYWQTYIGGLPIAARLGKDVTKYL